jgi:hypothetical protein
MDLFSGRLYKIGELRDATMAKVADTATAITKMWPDL